MIRFERRLTEVRRKMGEQGIDALFLAPSGDTEYLTGFRRQRPNATESHRFADIFYGVLVTRDIALVLAPYMAMSFVEEQVKGKPWIQEVVELPEGIEIPDVAVETFRRLGLTRARVGVPKFTFGMTLVTLQGLFPEMTFANTEPFLAPMRAIKDEEELAIMQRAAEVVDETYAAVLKKLKVGMTEMEIAAEVDWQLVRHGAEGTSFVTGIMCRGAQGSGGVEETVSRAGQVTLQPGCVLAFDFGSVVDGYCNDFGRTVYVGEPAAKFRRIHDLVMGSQAAAMAAMKGGQITAGQADRVAREYLKQGGFTKEFFHRLGHGIGIDVHERPFLQELDNTLLQNNMTFTVEPSILIPDKCFIRVEDVVVVTSRGAESLNRTSREIVVVE